MRGEHARPVIPEFICVVSEEASSRYLLLLSVHIPITLRLLLHLSLSPALPYGVRAPSQTNTYLLPLMCFASLCSYPMGACGKL